jgi:uncharacterized protein
MKLHEQALPKLNLVTGYGAGSVRIGGQEIAVPCIVAPGTLHTQWIATLDALTPDSLAALWPLQPRVVLAGISTGKGSTTLPRAVKAEFATRGVALEAMDLGAACRTYNVLAQEDRAVVAMLFP